MKPFRISTIHLDEDHAVTGVTAVVDQRYLDVLNDLLYRYLPRGTDDRGQVCEPGSADLSVELDTAEVVNLSVRLPARSPDTLPGALDAVLLVMRSSLIGAEDEYPPRTWEEHGCPDAGVWRGYTELSDVPELISRPCRMEPTEDGGVKITFNTGDVAYHTAGMKFRLSHPRMDRNSKVDTQPPTQCAVN